MNKKIRHAQLSDLDEIWQLRNETSSLLKSRQIDQWQHNLPDKQTFIKDINQGEFFVYEIDNKVVGMIAVKEGIEPTYNKIFEGNWSLDKPYMTIHRLAVNPLYLGKKISFELMEFAHQIARDKNINYLRIDTHENNLYAQRLFTNLKYQLKGYILLDKVHIGDRKRLAYDLVIKKG